jgi:ATP-dependent Clp protease ATP-binding subunit ClpA
VTATTTAIAVVHEARDRARELKSPVIGQEHVLLALGERPESSGGAAFAALGIEPGSIRSGLLAMISPGRASGEPAPTPRLQRALEEADAEAGERGRPTTSADLVLGILRSHQGVGFQLLGYAGVGEDALRRAVDGIAPGHAELEDVGDGSVAAAL